MRQHPVLAGIRRNLLRGLFLILPLLITLWMLSILFRDNCGSFYRILINRILIRDLNFLYKQSCKIKHKI